MQIVDRIKQNWLLILILLIGIAYRFLPIYNYEFSHDELSGISRTVFPSLIEELNKAIKIDAHPALIQLFLWYWVKLFGYNEIAIKLPFLICGVLSIYYIYTFGKEFFNKNVGLIAATIVSCSFIFLVYSSYSRMYISGVLFSILFLISLFKILFDDNINTKDYLFFVLFSLLCAYNHHMSSLFAFTAVVLSFFYINKSQLKEYSLFCLLAIILYLPHLEITLYQLSIGGIGAQVGGWLPPPRINEIYFFAKTLFGCGISGIISMILFFIFILNSIFKLNPLTKKQTFLFWLFIINYLIIHLYSVFKNPILQNSGLLFSGICLILFASSFIASFTKKQITILCLMFIGLFGFQNFYKKHLFSKVHVHEFEQQAKAYLEVEKKYGKNSVTGIFASEDFFVSIYESKYKSKFNYITVSDTAFKSILKLRNYLKSLPNNYVILGGINASTTQLIKEYYPYLYLHHEDYFSNIIVLSKIKQKNDDMSILKNNSILNSDLNIYTDSKKQLTFCNDSVWFKITKNDTDFPFNVELNLNKSKLKQYQCLVVELSYKADSINQILTDKLCLSISEKGKDAVFYKAESLADYFDSTKKIHTVYLEFFAGSDYLSWQNEKMNFNFFITKNKKSEYDIVNFKVKTIDYSPTRWTLWD